MIRLIAVLAVAALTTGCASIVNETTHPMKVETAKPDGSLLAGAECRLTNDYGPFSVRSGETLQIRRSNKDLDIVCRHAEQPDATGRAISRANAGLAGNILFGGGIGAIIDHSKGTAYTYPTWVRLVFGRSLVFDRTDEKDGQVLLGKDAGPGGPGEQAGTGTK